MTAEVTRITTGRTRSTWPGPRTTTWTAPTTPRAGRSGACTAVSPSTTFTPSSTVWFRLTDLQEISTPTASRERCCGSQASLEMPSPTFSNKKLKACLVVCGSCLGKNWLQCHPTVPHSLFRLYFDKTRSDCWNEIETKLLPLCSEVISYFLSLTSEAHSEAWTSVLLLLFTQLESLEEERLKRFAGQD